MYLLSFRVQLFCIFTCHIPCVKIADTCSLTGAKKALYRLVTMKVASQLLIPRNITLLRRCGYVRYPVIEHLSSGSVWANSFTIKHLLLLLSQALVKYFFDISLSFKTIILNSTLHSLPYLLRPSLLSS